MPEIKRNGVTIHYEIEGQGRPLMFHTGGWGDLNVWRLAGYTQALRSDHRLILMDHRGQGKSDRPRGRASHRIEEYLDDISAVLDDAHVPRTAFLGASSGGTIGYLFAEAHPDRLTALIDLDGIDAESFSAAAQEAIRKFVHEVRTRGWTAIIEELASDEGVPLNYPWLHKIARETDVDMGLLLVQAVANSGLKEPIAILEHLEIPCLILLNGQRVSGDSKGLNRILKAARGQAHVLEGTGHIRVCFESERTLPFIREFLDKAGV